MNEEEDVVGGTPAPEAGASGKPAGSGSGRRRRHRRVTAPPTNVDADQADDVARPRAAEPTVPVQGRDGWIQEQRPPHWD